MKGLSFLCLVGIFNAFYWGIKNQWMFNPSTQRGGNWWIGDAAVGLACFVLGPVLWNAARIRSQNRVAATAYRYSQGEATEEDFVDAHTQHERDFE